MLQIINLIVLFGSPQPYLDVSYTNVNRNPVFFFVYLSSTGLYHKNRQRQTGELTQNTYFYCNYNNK